MNPLSQGWFQYWTSPSSWSLLMWASLLGYSVERAGYNGVCLNGYIVMLAHLY